MRFTCEREPLADALGVVAKYAARTSPIPVLNHVLVGAGTGEIVLTGTDLERAARVGVPADTEASGAFCLPLELLHKAVKGGASGEVSVTVADGWAHVVMSKSRVKMPVLSHEDFPGDMPMLTGEAEHEFTVSAEWLKGLPRRVGFAVSTDINRYYLQGVMWRIQKELLECVAIDGHVVSIEEAPAPGVDDMPERLVPVVDLPEWLGDVQVETTALWARFRCGNTAVSTKLIEGTFPDFRRVVPKNETVILMDRAELARAINRVSINIDGKEHSILFAGENGNLTLSTRTAKGEAVDEVRYEGEDFRFAATSQLIRPALTALDSENVELRYADHMTPVTVHEPGNERRVLAVYPFRDPRLGETTVGEPYRQAAE